MQPLDIHCHSDVGSACSGFTVTQMVEAYYRYRLPAFVITDHHSLRGADLLEEKGVNVIPGVEIWLKDSVSKEYGEYLVFAPKEELRRMIEPVEMYYNRPVITLQDAIDRGLLHKDRLIVWCHPPYDFTDWFKFCMDHVIEYVDAVEVANYMASMVDTEYNRE